jgi:hypothetical protein
MFVIWGWGKQTRKVVGKVGNRMCNYCNTESIWQLVIVRTWFTLFFIPIIPYAKSYQISCPNCKSFFALSKEQFESLRDQTTATAGVPAMVDAGKYQGKTETQVNYLKAMEEAERKE